MSSKNKVVGCCLVVVVCLELRDAGHPCPITVYTLRHIRYNIYDTPVPCVARVARIDYEISVLSSCSDGHATQVQLLVRVAGPCTIVDGYMHRMQ
jgi:hypothetical protein